MQSELKPCAHCGGAAECDSRQTFRALSSGKIGKRFAIYCTSCNADMGFCYDDIESCNHEAAEVEIVAAWNTRASDAEITRMTEALRLQMEAKHKDAAEAKLWFSKAQEWKEALRKAEEREKALRAFTEKAGQVFRHYGDLHAAKPDMEKAKRNYDMADAARAALKEQPHD